MLKKRWEIKRKALLISESIARKTETRYDGCLNIKKKKKILSRHSSQTAHAKLVDR